MQFRNQSVLSMLMWIITKTFQITFWGFLVLLKLIPYFSAIIKSTIFTLTLWGSQICNFGINLCYLVDVDHYKNILDYLLGILSIARNQSVLSILMWIITKTAGFTLDYFWGSVSIAEINPIFFCNLIKPSIFADLL